MDYINLLYNKYVQEMQHLVGGTFLNSNQFASYIEQQIESMQSVCIKDGDALAGILFYRCWEDDEMKYCLTPSFGYYADKEKSLIQLFQQLTEIVLGEKKCRFLINIYAHDSESLQVFHMMQFGNMAEKGVRKISEAESFAETEIPIRVLRKTEIEQRWDMIWKNTTEIVKHLQKTPVFYPGKEFTETVYKGFFLSEDTELIAAFHQDEIIGLIEWNKEPCELVCGAIPSVNVGEAYVISAYRGTGLAQSMLNYAEKQAKENGMQYLWVEHGTANPNARGFWNKYFQTYQYELVREIQREGV